MFYDKKSKLPLPSSSHFSISSLLLVVEVHVKYCHSLPTNREKWGETLFFFFMIRSFLSLLLCYPLLSIYSTRKCVIFDKRIQKRRESLKKVFDTGFGAVQVFHSFTLCLPSNSCSRTYRLHAFQTLTHGSSDDTEEKKGDSIESERRSRDTQNAYKTRKDE